MLSYAGCVGIAVLILPDKRKNSVKAEARANTAAKDNSCLDKKYFNYCSWRPFSPHRPREFTMSDRREKIWFVGWKEIKM